MAVDQTRGAPTQAVPTQAVPTQAVPPAVAPDPNAPPAAAAPARRGVRCPALCSSTCSTAARPSRAPGRAFRRKLHRGARARSRGSGGAIGSSAVASSPRAPHRKWTRRFPRLTARRGDGRGHIPARAEPRKRTHVAMQLSPHKSPISATWRPFWTTRVPLSVPATLLETPNEARRRKDGRTAASAMRSGQLRAKVVDSPIFLLIFLAGLLR